MACCHRAATLMTSLREQLIDDLRDATKPRHRPPHNIQTLPISICSISQRRASHRSGGAAAASGISPPKRYISPAGGPQRVRNPARRMPHGGRPCVNKIIPELRTCV